MIGGLAHHGHRRPRDHTVGHAVQFYSAGRPARSSTRAARGPTSESAEASLSGCDDTGKPAPDIARPMTWRQRATALGTPATMARSGSGRAHQVSATQVSDAGLGRGVGQSGGEDVTEQHRRTLSPQLTQPRPVHEPRRLAAHGDLGGDGTVVRDDRKAIALNEDRSRVAEGIACCLERRRDHRKRCYARRGRPTLS